VRLPAFLQRAIYALVARYSPGDHRVFIGRRQAGVLVTEDTALTLGEWWACVNLVARTIASLPWGVYQKTDNGREPMDNGIAWLLNNRPNPEMSAFSFRETLIAHAVNWGNGYAEISWDMAGRAAALWIIPPDRVVPERNPDTDALQYRISGGDGKQTILQSSDVLHVHGLGFDGVTGYSVARMAARSIGLGIGQDTFATAFYGNGTQFGNVIEMPGQMNSDQIKLAEAYYNDAHSGPDKAFKIRVAPSGVKVHPLGMPLTDAQFIESRGLTITMAARWLGVPPHKIADLTRSTNNNIEHQGIEFVTDAIVPWCQRLEQEVNFKLFAPRSQGKLYTKLNVNGLMRGDAKSRAEFYRTMTQIGAMTINEVRALEDLNGIGEDGDEHLVQLNQTTLERIIEGTPQAGPTPAEPAEPETEEPNEEIRSAALAFVRGGRT
jgi:HK97 family phage portal protein